MSRKKPINRQEPEPLRQPPPYLWPAAIVLAVLIFYWTPLTSSNASIQWDAVDVHYSSQKYFADHLRSGSLPFWTPYIFSGFPFLADLQVGAFYPLNWPFFLIGITPGAIEVELFLHALLACMGAFLLGKKVIGCSTAGLAAAFFYGLSGYFAAHSSHVGIFQTAAWLPWLLYGFLRSIESPSPKLVSLTGLAAGCMILAGHFQTALYAFCALAICAAVQLALDPVRRVRIAAIFASIVVGGVLLSAIQTMPGLELVGESIRAGVNTSTSREGVLPPGSLITLISADHLGAPGLDSTYKGPPDITQHYFYAGMLLLPFAIAGAIYGASRLRRLAAALILPAVWYALGPDGGFYRVIALLPAFSSVRAPVHVWFVAALGFALLAGAGFDWAAKKFPHPALAGVALAILFIDLYYWNSANNKLAYAHQSYENLYGPGIQQQQAIAVQAPLTRFHAPDALPSFGSLNHPLDIKVETTFGYNPLELKRYADYMQAAKSDRTLLDDLAVTRILDMQVGGIGPNVTVRPFVMFPKGGGTAAVTGHDEQSYRIRYHADAESQLRVAVPYFPGWRASNGGTKLRVEPLNGALLGITVPAGDGEIDLQFRSNYFIAGAMVSLVATLALLALALRRSAPALAD